MKIVHYMFYFIYSQMIQYRSRKESVFYSSLVFAIFQVFIFYIISFIVESISGYYYNLNELEIMLLYFSFSFICSYYFYKDRKYIQIKLKYANQNDNQKRIRGRFVLLIFFSIMITYFFLAIMRSV